MSWFNEDDGQPRQQIAMFNDRGIISLIEKGHIRPKDPSKFLGPRRNEFIQPASMDVALAGYDFDDVYPHLENIAAMYPHRDLTGREHHPDLSDDYVTFWPGHLSCPHIQDFEGHIHVPAIFPKLAIRSTPRRLGLEVGRGLESILGGPLSADILNARKYPISAQIGTRLWQLLWHEHPVTLYEHNDGMVNYVLYDEDERPPAPLRLATGQYISDDKQIAYLIKHGELEISPKPVIKNGVIYFHASKTESRYKQDHLVLHKDGRKTDAMGNKLETLVTDTDMHVIQPGEFVDIETQERVRLSDKIGITIYYGRGFERKFDFGLAVREHVARQMITSLQGGWIDPGYPSIGNPEMGRISVQLMALTETLKIRAGQPVAIGVVTYFPEGCALPYGDPRRNSQYTTPIFLKS